MFDDAQLHLSPVHQQMGMTVVEHKPGFVVLSMPIHDDMRGMLGYTRISTQGKVVPTGA